MSEPRIRIVKSILEFFVLAVLAVMPAMLVNIDLGDAGVWKGEFTLTELAQELLLTGTALLFWTLAVKRPDLRGFTVLVAGFFTCALIRELDALFDQIQHGFWVYPALLVTMVSVTCAVVFNRATIARPMVLFLHTKAYFLMAIGLVTLLFFSRTIGSGNLLWSGLLGDAYSNDFKNALQEGIELYGYILIGYSAVLYSTLQLSQSHQVMAGAGEWQDYSPSTGVARVFSPFS